MTLATNSHPLINHIRSLKVSAIIRAQDQAIAAHAMQAAIDGGFRLIEFTLTTPGAYELIHNFSKRSDLVVGAGTVLRPEQARNAVKAGARFLVSPVCDPEIISLSNELGVVSVPGTFTATEMHRAHQAGAHLVKLFPAPADVADYVRSTLGPLPFLNIFPTAGVDENNFVEVLRVGATGVGFVRSLFDPHDMDRGNFDAIRTRAQRIHDLLTAANLPN